MKSTLNFDIFEIPLSFEIWVTQNMFEVFVQSALIYRFSVFFLFLKLFKNKIQREKRGCTIEPPHSFKPK